MKPSGTFLRTAFGLAVPTTFLAGADPLLKCIGRVFASFQQRVETLIAIASVVVLLCAAIVAQSLKARGGWRSPGVTAEQRISTYAQLSAALVPRRTSGRGPKGCLLCPAAPT